ncbi:MAG: putative phage abortive infection protein [Aeriscardovia sp.]|nr:putative phage abortive infection protein [Aeriscardovia sp.]
MQDKKHYLYIVVIALIVVLTIYFVALSEMDSIIVFFRGGMGDDRENARGLFGDSTGAINTLFSSLAFAGVILTIYWQIQESSKNKEEDHRKQFEDVFFRMTANFEQIIAGLRIEVKESDLFDFSALWNSLGSNNPIHVASVNNGPITTPAMSVVQSVPTVTTGQTQHERIVKEGREVFQFLYEQQKKDGYSMVEAIEASGIEGYEGFIQGELDHYYRYFYRILRYIDDSKLIDSEQKYSYAAILRAHLSIYELLLLYYNGLSDAGFDRLKPLMERYSMLDNMREEKLVFGSVEGERVALGIGEYYTDSAFGHLQPKSYEKVVALRNRAIWTSVLTVAVAAFALPLWNSVVVDDILHKIPGDSFPLFYAIMTIVGFYLWNYWKRDAVLVGDIHGLRHPTDEEKNDIMNRIVKRFRMLPGILAVILAAFIAVMLSDYELNGGLSLCYIYVIGLAIVYHVFALIIIRLEVQDAKLMRKVELFEK